MAKRGVRWAVRSAEDAAPRIGRENRVVRKLARVALETLAVSAYHQPVTRAEIEEIRGVALSKGTLDALLEIGWLHPKGRRKTPGRPDRKSVVWGKSVSVRVDPGGRRILQKKKVSEKMQQAISCNTLSYHSEQKNQTHHKT